LQKLKEKSPCQPKNSNNRATKQNLCLSVNVFHTYMLLSLEQLETSSQKRPKISPNSFLAKQQKYKRKVKIRQPFLAIYNL
jgi:hypothetical protein